MKFSHMYFFLLHFQKFLRCIRRWKHTQHEKWYVRTCMLRLLTDIQMFLIRVLWSPAMNRFESRCSFLCVRTECYFYYSLLFLHSLTYTLFSSPLQLSHIHTRSLYLPISLSHLLAHMHTPFFFLPLPFCLSLFFLPLFLSLFPFPLRNYWPRSVPSTWWATSRTKITFSFGWTARTARKSNPRTDTYFLTAIPVIDALAQGLIFNSTCPIPSSPVFHSSLLLSYCSNNVVVRPPLLSQTPRLIFSILIPCMSIPCRPDSLIMWSVPVPPVPIRPSGNTRTYVHA